MFAKTDLLLSTHHQTPLLGAKQSSSIRPALGLSMFHHPMASRSRHNLLQPPGSVYQVCDFSIISTWEEGRPLRVELQVSPVSINLTYGFLTQLLLAAPFRFVSCRQRLQVRT